MTPKRGLAIGISIVCIIVALIVIFGRQLSATPAPAVARSADDSSQASAQPSVAQQEANAAPTQTPQEQYLTIVNNVRTKDVRQALGWEPAEPTVTVDGENITVGLPLNPAPNEDQLVRLAKANITRIVNALYQGTNVQKVTVIGTVPMGGDEHARVSVATERGSYAWGTMNASAINEAFPFKVVE